jgi:GAF domain-containing protein
MSELQKQKLNILAQLRGLCAHCSSDSNRPHYCPVQQISARIQALRGVPLIVNSQFKGVLWPRV